MSDDDFYDEMFSEIQEAKKYIIAKFLNNGVKYALIPSIIMFLLKDCMVAASETVLKSDGRIMFDRYVKVSGDQLNQIVKKMNQELSEIVKEQRVKGGGR